MRLTRGRICTCGRCFDEQDCGYATHPATGRWSRFDHAAFGSVLGEDGKPFKTRSGDSVKLADLIRETFDRADKAVRSKCAERGVSAEDEEFAKTSRCVGIAAQVCGSF